MLRVGLTGGIACGKSHVLTGLAQAGLHTLDLDRVAHELMLPGGAAYAEVLQAFGPGILGPDARIDRKALGAQVFADATARERLNAIVHPKVRAEEARRAGEHAGDPGAVFVTDAALLVESGVHLRFDRLVVVCCSEDEQLRRLMARDGIPEDAARARVAAQMPIAEKRRFAHRIVETSGSVDDTRRAGGVLAAELRRLAAAPRERVHVPLERALGVFLHGPVHGPRGLDPGGVLREIVAGAGLEMERVARRMAPPPQGPWYRAAHESGAGAGPERLAAPIALWALSRAADDEFLAAAAASLARLTHVEPPAIADACLFALALHDVLRRGGLAQDLETRLEGWSRVAERWAGGPPRPGRLARSLEAARGHATDVALAPASDRGARDPDMAGAFAGAIVGAPPAAAPEALVRDLAALVAPQS